MQLPMSYDSFINVAVLVD